MTMTGKGLYLRTLLLLTFLLSGQAQEATQLQFERSFTLEGSGCSDLKWTVDREALKLTVQWKSSPDAEWTAFGISEFGGMKGADVALVKTTPTDGRFDVQDLFSTDFGLPQLDILQNVELLDATYTDDGRLQVTIQRDLDTCDQQDIEVKPQKQYLICASGALSTVDGSTPLYHGNQRSTGLVNLMMDEELLFERTLEASNETAKTYLAPGVTAHHEDPTQAVTPFPVDIQMPNISLNGHVTSYRCRAFNLTQPMKFTAYEQVWGDGETILSGSTNDILHHQHITICKDPTVLTASQLSGEPWDCMAKMPSCEVVVAHARGTGVMEVPAGLHLPLEAGTYVHLIHYENPHGKEVTNDQSGFRLWVEPLQDDDDNSNSTTISHTQPAMIAAHEGMFDSLVIPADPLQREITLQFLISAEATQDILPPDGVQAFGSVLHMHKLGVRGRVELIRNGTHIMDVYRSQSYDFDRQTPDFKTWRFLPGDALIVSCTYKPLKDRDVVGGFRTADEMGIFFVAFAPAVPNYGYSMGVFVKEGEPFLNSHMGGNDDGVHSRHMNYSDYKYEPIPKKYDDSIAPLKHHRKNVCQNFIKEDLLINTITYADPAVFTQVMIIFAFVVVSVLSRATVLQWIGVPPSDNLRERRNAVVYLGQLLFSSVVLPFLCWELIQIYHQDDSFDAVHPNQHGVARGIMVTQAVLYLLELFYRIEVRWSLVLHHMMTSLTVIYLGIVLTQSYQLLVLKFGIGLTLLAVTEQPLYLVLLLRLVGHRERAAASAKRLSWSTLCRLACGAFVATRIVVIVLMVVLLTQQSRRTDIAWQFLSTSFGHWHDPSSDFLGSPQYINAMLIVLLSGILFSNYFAIKAMLHMANWKPSFSVVEIAKRSHVGSTDELDMQSRPCFDLETGADDESSSSAP